MPNEFVEAREQLPGALATLPASALASGAGAFLQIVEELRRSFAVELRALVAVLTVDPTDAQAVSALRWTLEFGEQSLAAERTHCHNIDRVANEIVAPLQLAGDEALAARIAALVEPLRNADGEYLDDVETVVGAATRAAVAIDDLVQAGKLDEARRVQREFGVAVKPTLDSIKTTLKTMNGLANDLIDEL